MESQTKTASYQVRFISREELLRILKGRRFTSAGSNSAIKQAGEQS